MARHAPVKASKLRVQYPGAIYYDMNRGDRREAILRGDKDRLRFLERLGDGGSRCQPRTVSRVARRPIKALLRKG